MSDLSKLTDAEIEKRIREIEAEAKPKGLTGFDKALFVARSAAEGHTFGISEPVISATKAALAAGTGGAKFGDAFAADVEQRRKEKAENKGTDIAAQIGGALVPSPINLFSKTVGVATAGAKALGLTGRTLLPTIARGAVIGGGTGLVSQSVKEASGRPTGFVQEGTAAGNIAKSTAIGAALGAPMEIAVGKIQGMAEARRMANPNSAKVVEAGKALGAKPTPGQLSANRLVQKLEQSLEQTPHWGAGDVKASIAQSKAAPINAVDSIAAQGTSHTATEVGSSVRKQIVDSVAKKLEPAEHIYETLEKQLAKGEAEILNANNAIAELREMSKTATQLRPIVEQASDALGNVQTVAHLKNVRTSIGAMSRKGDLDDLQRMALGKLYDALTKDRTASLARLSPKSEGLLSQADEIYANVSNELRESLPISDRVGPKGIERALDKFSDTALPKTLFNTKDVNRVVELQKQFPKQFEEMRQLRISELLRGTGGKPVTPSVLVNRFYNLEPEARNIIFGKDSSKKIEAIKTWLESMPQSSAPGRVGKLGPSGTPEGMHYIDFVTRALTLLGPGETYGQKIIYQMLGDAANSIANPLVRRATLQAGRVGELVELPSGGPIERLKRRNTK